MTINDIAANQAHVQSSVAASVTSGGSQNEPDNKIGPGGPATHTTVSPEALDLYKDAIASGNAVDAGA